MQELWHSISGFFIPGLILLVGIAFLMALWVVSRRYKKIPPSKVGIFYGRKHKVKDSDGNTVERGFRVVASGGGIVMPLVENYQELSTSAFQITIDEKGIPNKDNVPINVGGIATCKISTAPEDLLNAAENFLGKTDQEIWGMVKNILKGHLRSIIGNMTIDELLRKRDEFNKKVVAESTAELKRLGIQVINLVVQDVNDTLGYIESLGKQAVAEAVRDADIKTSNATKESATVKAQNEAFISDAEKERDLKIADNRVKVETANAKADKANAIEMAAQDEVLKVAEAKRDAAAAEAGIEVQMKLADQKEAELVATVIKPAEASKKRVAIDAEAAKQKLEIDADAEAAAAVKKAEGLKKSEVLKGEGQASFVTQTKKAEAEGAKAVLLAQAEGKERSLLADAKGIETRLLAEAAGKTADAAATEKMAEALKKMDDRGQLILILKALPEIMDHGGDAVSKVAEAMFKPIGAGLGSIDKVNIVDMGGNGSGISNFAGQVPKTVVQAITALKTMGLDLTPLLEKFKIDPSKLNEILGASGDAPATGASSTTVDA